MDILFEMNEEPMPLIGVVNGKWCLHGDPVSELSRNERNLVFNHISEVREAHEKANY